MLNRRLLRIKAMQTIYSFKQNEESDFNLALEKLKEDFRFELNMIGKIEAPRMKVEEDIATQVFRNAVLPAEQVAVEIEKLSEKSKELANDTILFFKTKRSKDYISHKSKMVGNAEKIYDRYILLLHLFNEMVSIDTKLGIFTNNLAISCLLQSEKLQRLIQAKTVKWDTATVRSWYKALQKEEELLKAIEQESDDFEGHKMRFRIIARDFVFKHDLVVSYFDELDMNWAENKSILKSMLANTIKSIEADSCKETDLFMLSRNWEDDSYFFKQLFELYAEQENYYDELIAEKAKTWSADRIAVVDKILMKMAICEILNFHNIPVKVSINEYIDISKSYSTPKSGQYINGMLDEISKKLDREGKIKKSGRGLIDNK